MNARETSRPVDAADPDAEAGARPPNHDVDSTSSDGISENVAYQPRPRTHKEESVAYVTVSDPVQHTEGIKGKFTMYRVSYDPPPPTTYVDAGANDAGFNSMSLFPYTTSVNRRYSDFAWLFDHLHKERPGAIVPPLPEKQQVSRFTESFIEERRYHLEIFLRRVVCNQELKDTECLLIFLGGGDAEFKKAKKDGNFGATSGRSNHDAGVAQTMNDEYQDEMGDDNQAEQHNNTLVDRGKERLSHKKAGIKKWIKEKKTTMQGTMVRSPDDAVFEEAAHFISALEVGLKRVEAQASAMVKRDKDVAACLFEFGLGCDTLARIDDEVNNTETGDESGASVMSQTFRMIGKTADAASTVSSDHYEKQLSRFAEPLRDQLKMVHAAKVALSKRNNRRITYSTCLNAVDSKKANLHKCRITPGQEGKAYGVESSLSRAEAAVAMARANYEEVSVRVLRELDRFRRENVVAMYEMISEFVRCQKEYHGRMDNVWGNLLPQIKEVDPAKLKRSSFAKVAVTLREGSKSGNTSSRGGVESVATQVDNMPMPSYPPPAAPEPATINNVQKQNVMIESSTLNGAVRYRDPLPGESK